MSKIPGMVCIFRLVGLGFKNSPNYCDAFEWFRLNWGYSSWIEKSEKKIHL